MILTLGWILHWILLGYGFGRWAAVRWVFLLGFSVLLIFGSESIPLSLAELTSRRAGEPHFLITLGLFAVAGIWGRANEEGISIGVLFEGAVKRVFRDIYIWRRLREAKKVNRIVAEKEGR